MFLRIFFGVITLLCVGCYPTDFMTYYTLNDPGTQISHRCYPWYIYVPIASIITQPSSCNCQPSITNEVTTSEPEAQAPSLTTTPGAEIGKILKTDVDTICMRYPESKKAIYKYDESTFIKVSHNNYADLDNAKIYKCNNTNIFAVQYCVKTLCTNLTNPTFIVD